MSLIDQAIQHYNEVNAKNTREAVEQVAKGNREKAEKTVELVQRKLGLTAQPIYEDGMAKVDDIIFMAHNPGYEYDYHWSLLVRVACPLCQEKGWQECDGLYALGSIATNNFALKGYDHECPEHKAAHEKQQADQAAADERRREKLLGQVMMDPVAFRLLQVFSEILRERAEWHDQLSNANDCATHLEESYGARLSRAEQSARDAQREAENARYEAGEARDDADRAERKLKQAG